MKRVTDNAHRPGPELISYVTIEFKVPERSYAAWPNPIQSAFEPARTAEAAHRLGARADGAPGQRRGSPDR